MRWMYSHSCLTAVHADAALLRCLCCAVSLLCCSCLARPRVTSCGQQAWSRPAMLLGGCC